MECISLKKIKIAIDGPAASGKTTAGSLLAKRLGVNFLDTGIMYRVVTWVALDRGIDVFDEGAISNLAAELGIEIKTPSKDDGRINDIIVDGRDITLEIRSEAVNKNVSQVSTYSSVRESLTRKQRLIAETESIVMTGRDIGTVVLPHADYKFFLDASLEERARRRQKEMCEKIALDEIMRGLLLRDNIDSNREIAPLRPAEDAIIIDTEDKTLGEVVDKMASIVMSGKIRKNYRK